MNENSYFNPEDMRAQCDAAINNLEEDNRANGIIEEKIMEFITEHTLAGKAFEAAKQQMLDYVAVLHAMKLANEADIADFRYLKLMSIGSEIDGNFILSEKEGALSERKINGEKAEKYRKKAQKEQSMLIRQQYMTKVAHYMAMEVINQELYNELQKEEEKYDAIESLTNGLFEQGTTIRLVVENALSSMQGAFQNGVYVPDMQAGWRKEINQEYQNYLLRFGYTQEEIDILKIMGVNITYKDIMNLKATMGNEKVFISEDYKALLYQGKVYIIDVPKDEMSYQGTWKKDGQMTLTKTEFDWAAGILGINLEDIPKEELFDHNGKHRLQRAEVSGKDKNVTTAVALHIIMGIESFFVSSLEHMEIKVFFESSGNQRKATIMVGDSQTRLRMQEIDYGMPVNTYRDSSGVLGNKYASDYAIGMYKMITGKEVPDKNDTYTITGTLDERHRETNINGYLSYSEDGELLYTPLIYAGDTAYISTCQKFTGYNAKEILEFTDMLSNSVVADDEMKKILEQALEEYDNGK